MTWLKKDDRFPEHRKIRRLTDAAYRLHDTALCYSAKDESDGFLDESDIDEMQHGKRLRKNIAALIEAGLWEVVDGGWLLHDFLDYNPSHGRQEAKRAAARERQEKFRLKRVAEDTGNAVTNALVTRESHAPVPSRPDPSRPVPNVGVLRVVGDLTSNPDRHLSDGASRASSGLGGNS